MVLLTDDARNARQHPTRENIVRKVQMSFLKLNLDFRRISLRLMPCIGLSVALPRTTRCSSITPATEVKQRILTEMRQTVLMKVSTSHEASAPPYSPISFTVIYPVGGIRQVLFWGRSFFHRLITNRPVILSMM